MSDRDGMPVGFVLEAIRHGKRYYRGPNEIVVTGTPPNDEHLPEEEQHNCDAMGCRWEHVLERISISQKLGTNRVQDSATQPEAIVPDTNTTPVAATNRVTNRAGR